MIKSCLQGMFLEAAAAAGPSRSRYFLLRRPARWAPLPRSICREPVSMKIREPLAISTRVRRIAFGVLLLLSFVGLFPLSARIAHPLATRKFDPSLDARILLLWPDHIELRPISTLNDVSPRPRNADYSFLVPKDREDWVRARLRAFDPRPDANWVIRVKDLSRGRQRIQLEIISDGFWGTVYEADADHITPLGTRLTGPGFAFVVLAVHLVICGSMWRLVFVGKRRLWPSRPTAVLITAP
jgi:hypothetical protein